jgi:hypothetical protein
LTVSIVASGFNCFAIRLAVRPDSSRTSAAGRGDFKQIATG